MSKSDPSVPKAYEFGASRRLTFDQGRFLEMVLRDFADASVRVLSPLLRSRFEMTLASVVSMAYHQHLSTLSEFGPLFVFALKDRTPGLLSLELPLAFALFEELLGGLGRSQGLPRAQLTDLEKGILEIPMARIFSSYSEAWRGVYPLDPTLQRLEFNTKAVHVCRPSERMVVTNFELVTARASGLLRVCLPFYCLKKVVPKDSFEEFMLKRDGSWTPDGGAVSKETLQAAKVVVSMVLGAAEVPFQELLRVEVGDVVRLDTEIGDPLKIRVNGRDTYLGRPGVCKGRLACRLLGTTVAQEI